LPTFVYSAYSRGVSVNLFENSHAEIPLATGGQVVLDQETSFPLGGVVTLTVSPKDVPANHGEFTIRLRIPAWASSPTEAVKVEWATERAVPGEFLEFTRKWRAGDKIRLTMNVPRRLVIGDHENAGKAAVMVGPIVLAADDALNPDLQPIQRVTISQSDP